METTFFVLLKKEKNFFDLVLKEVSCGKILVNEWNFLYCITSYIHIYLSTRAKIIFE